MSVNHNEQDHHFLRATLKDSDYDQRETLALTHIRQTASELFSFASKHPKPQNLSEEIVHYGNERAGTCSGKHYFLGHQLEELSFSTLYLSIPFYWQELPVIYPLLLQELVNDMPLQYHAALLVLNQSQPELIDVTWDPALEQIGLPSASRINQFTSTTMAVKPAGPPVIHLSANERWQFVQEIKQKMKFQANVPSFYNGLMEWFNQLRAKPLSKGN